MKRKSKITLSQSSGLIGKVNYEVIALTNRTEPKVGSHLKEDEVKKLLNDEQDLTVDIRKRK
jgi:hypothetical protein